VVLGNFLSAPSNCGANPGPVPLKASRKANARRCGLANRRNRRSSHRQLPRPEIPAIALFYTATRDFEGKDSVQIEFEAGDNNKVPALSFQITVQGNDGK